MYDYEDWQARRRRFQLQPPPRKEHDMTPVTNDRPVWDTRESEWDERSDQEVLAEWYAKERDGLPTAKERQAAFEALAELHLQAIFPPAE